MKRLYSLSALATTALLLSACSGTATPEPQSDESTATAEAPTSAALTAGKFELASETGAKVTFTMPADLASEEVAALESFRTEAGAEAVSYIVADVDNRAGTEPADLTCITAFDTEGNQYEFTSPSGFVEEWGPYYSDEYEYVLPNGDVMDEAAGEALSSRGVDLYNAHLTGADASERKTLVLISSTAELPTKFTRVAVVVGDILTDAEDATQASAGN